MDIICNNTKPQTSEISLLPQSLYCEFQSVIGNLRRVNCMTWKPGTGILNEFDCKNSAWSTISLLRNISMPANCPCLKVRLLSRHFLDLPKLQTLIKSHIIKNTCKCMANRLKKLYHLLLSSKINVGVIHSDYASRSRFQVRPNDTFRNWRGHTPCGLWSMV